VTAIAADAAAFKSSTRRPLVLGKSAYWVSAGRLVRRSLGAGAALEVLQTDARTGTKVAGALVAQKPHVVYITQNASGDPRARLWVEGGPVVDLSPEGSSASSIALLPQRSGPLTFVALEGRSGMSPLHARPLGNSGRVELAADEVVWVGGGAQARTELDVVEDERGDGWALVPLERSATEFGLAAIPLSRGDVAPETVSWKAYANGLDVPAIAAGRICRKPVVLSVRPASADPSAPQRLHWSTLEGGALVDQHVVLEAQNIRDVSMAPLETGGLIAVLAKGRVLAVRVRCGVP
jgi:hypothetical protein